VAAVSVLIIACQCAALWLAGGNVRTRTPAPGISGTVGRAVELDFQMAIVEVVPLLRSHAPDL
jgi:hypothetical protein